MYRAYNDVLMILIFGETFPRPRDMRDTCLSVSDIIISVRKNYSRFAYRDPL